jgi:hypothetical protein
VNSRCTDQVPLPPHCPFDRTIIGDLPDYDGINLTTLGTVEDYERLVTAARAEAGTPPLAQWELETYTSG